MDQGGNPQINQRTRKLMTMHKALHPRDHVDYSCQEKKEEEDSPLLKITLMHQYEISMPTTKKSKEKLAAATSNINDNIKTK